MYHVSLALLGKKPSLHSQLLQLLLAVGLLRWTAQPEQWSPQYISNNPTGFRGGLDALQLAPWETYVPRASPIHPKALLQDGHLFDLGALCDYNRLARAASRGPLIAYLAEDGAPCRAPHGSAGSTAVEDCQTEALSREDADLIEILWKQDVDLGIPLEDYRPCNAAAQPSVTTAAAPAKSVEGTNLVQVLEKSEPKKDFESSPNEPRVTSIDSETGEPTFEPVAGPSTLDGVLINNSSSDSFLDINALMGVVNEELFFADPDWAQMSGYSGASSPPYNGTDPFGGVLLQNVSMPSSFDASVTAANTTMQQQDSPAATSCFSATAPATTAAITTSTSTGESNSAGSGYGELTKPTVTDQHAVRDLFTYNSSTQGNWDHFELFCEDLAVIATNTTTTTTTNTNANATTNLIVRTQDYLHKRIDSRDYHKTWWKRRKLDKYNDYESESSSFCSSGSESDSESNRLVPLGHSPINQTANRMTSNPATNGPATTLKHNAIGDGGYAASDTGVSSMYSDEANEEWMESASEASHDHDQEQLVTTDISYHSNSSSMSFGSAEGCAVPQKKYNFFGRKLYQQGHTSNGTVELSEESHVVPQPLEISHNPAMDGFLHNHSYGQEQLSASYNVPQLSVGLKVEQYRSEQRSQRPASQVDGYESSDPSENGTGYTQVTSAKDERRARELKIPIPTEDIVTLSIDEFNERLARYELSEDQLVLIRDIRRRGKNKVAAQNCRKRKLDQISALQGEVENFHDTCHALETENENLTRREAFAQQRLNHLRDVIASAARSGAIPKHHSHPNMAN